MLLEILNILLQPLKFVFKWIYINSLPNKLNKLITIDPINSLGENIFHINKRTSNPNHLEKFFVKTHFRLSGKYDINIVNIDLDYDVNAAPLQKKIIIDGHKERLDGSFNMVSQSHLRKGKVANIFISCGFACRYSSSDHLDYGRVKIYLDVSSNEWSGIKKFLIFGQLAPCGELNVVKIKKMRN